MSTIILQPIMDLSFEKFTAAFNRAYSDYYMPIVMNVNAFQALIEREDLDLDASVAAVDGRNIVGMGMLGIRGQQGWIGGMGLIPERRRQGIGREMMHYLLEQARQRSIMHLDLEVIEANTGARALYHETGFSDRRFLHMLVHEPQPVPPPDAAYHIARHDPEALLAYYDAFHDTANCWQRGYRSLQGLVPHAQGLAMLHEEAVAGYAFGWFAPDSIRFADLAVRVTDTETRRALARALVLYSHRVYPDAHGNAFNVADDDPLLQVYKAAGYQTQMRQIEMTLAL